MCAKVTGGEIEYVKDLLEDLLAGNPHYCRTQQHTGRKGSCILEPHLLIFTGNTKWMLSNKE